MDVVPPAGAMHSPAILTSLSESGAMPFARLWSRSLDPVLDDLHPARVLVSLAYLSQLPAAIDLCRHLGRRGYPVSVGGSLPNSLKATGRGSAILEAHLPEVLYGDGSVLLGGSGSGEGMLDRLAWPGTAGPRAEYISPRPVIPFAASTGCWWNRCLFCPDRTQPFGRVSDEALEMLLSTAPREVLSRGPVVHLLDSAVSPASLSRLMPVIRRFDAAFYGFARPGAEFLADGLPEEMAASGCAMMQYGVETADQALLRAYDKGLEVETVRSVLRRTAAAGIRTYAYFLFGLPGEDCDSTERTIAFIEEEEGSIDFLNLSVFNLPARSELASRAAEFGMETFERDSGEGRISLYTPFTVGGRSCRFAARRHIAAARASRPGFRRALARTPGWFRAAHLAMLEIGGRRPLPRPVLPGAGDPQPSVADAV